MAESLDLAITGVGAATPVGLSAAATCAALRAGVARLGEVHTFLVEGELVGNESAVGGRVPTEWYTGGPSITEWPGHERFSMGEPPAPEQIVASGPARLEELAVPAAREAWADAGLTDGEAWGLWLGLDETDAEQTPLGAVAAALGASAPAVSEAVAAGRGSALAALRNAAKALRADEVEVALVGGVDSLIRRERLAALSEAGALRSASHPQGVLPGEGAAFVVLERESRARGRDADRARVLALGTEDEPTAGTDDANQAVGLTRLLRKVLRDWPGGDAPLTVCDLNGDRYRAMEWTMASMRALAGHTGDQLIWHPADCIGDPGAASGAINLVWTVAAFDKGYAPRDQALVWGASDGALRAACLLHRPEGGSRA